MLFDQKIRTDIRSALGNENSFEYFNNTARVDVEPIRQLLEDWYKIYPDADKLEIKQRLKADFYPAFYELGMYCYFINQGFEVTIHPQIPNSSKHPDFLVKKGSLEFYVEIKEMRMSSDKERSTARLTNTLTDSLNLIDSTNFLLSIKKILFKDGSQPSGKKIIAHFDSLISNIEPDGYRELLENGGYDQLPSLFFEDHTVFISLKLIPKAPHLRGNNGRAIGSYGAYSKVGGDETEIRDALIPKAKKYGELDKPFLICLNYPSTFLDPEDVQKALFGLDQRMYSNGFDGLFGTQEAPKSTRVSAVLVTGFTIPGLIRAKMCFHKNPFAKRELSFSPPFDLGKYLALNTDYIARFS